MRILTLTCLALTLAAGAASAATHTIMQQGMAFVPDDLTIEVGDTVEWVHDSTSSFHTVTSGTGAADANAGVLFDETFNQSGQVFTHTFTAVGDQFYFCRPHEAFGMTGVVHVNNMVSAELSTWSALKDLWR